LVDITVIIPRCIGELGQVISVGTKHSSGVAWGRIFGRETRQGLELLKDGWFEDTVQA